MAFPICSFPGERANLIMRESRDQEGLAVLFCTPTASFNNRMI
jgi:hypothetical protein